jgi:hypothetical protein
VTNFGDDLRNGLVLGALLAAHWPGGNGVMHSEHCCSPPACTAARLSAGCLQVTHGSCWLVSNVGFTVYNCAWLNGACVSAGGKVGSLVSRLHQSPNDARHLRENQDMVVKALQVIHGIAGSE